jgi:hypothetical protein
LLVTNESTASRDTTLCVTMTIHYDKMLQQYDP